MEGFRKRAATLLSASRLQIDTVVNEQRPNGRHGVQHSGADERDEQSHIDSSRSQSGDTVSDSESAPASSQRELGSAFSHSPVRVLPPWVLNAQEDDDTEVEPDSSSALLPREPTLVHAAQHNHTPVVTQHPGFFQRNKHEPGRKYDARRRSEPPTPKHHPRETASRWKQFAEDSEYPHNVDEDWKLVENRDLDHTGPDFSDTWHKHHEDVEVNTYRPRRRTAWARAQRTILRSAFIPLIFRLLILIFCVMAIGLGATIYQMTRDMPHSTPNLPTSCYIDFETTTISPLMAVIIDSAAIVYLFGITWDEYKGLPLGLRSGKAKVSVLLFDLFFIVFSSANVTLAFEGVRSFGAACQQQDGLQRMRWKQEYLASTLLVALVAWLMTFAISVLRVVEKFDH